MPYTLEKTLQDIEFQIKKDKTRRLIRDMLYPVTKEQYENGLHASHEFTDIILIRRYKDTYLYPDFARYLRSKGFVKTLSENTIIKYLIEGCDIYDLHEMDSEAIDSILQGVEHE